MVPASQIGYCNVHTHYLKTEIYHKKVSMLRRNIVTANSVNGPLNNTLLDPFLDKP